MTKFYKDKEQIINWLDKHKVYNYALIPDERYDFIVNVSGNVNLRNKDLFYIPVKFGEVTGSFWCHSNQLTSREFCPQTVGRDFYCSNNQLDSLQFCPEIVGGKFNCSNNQLTSLKYCTKEINWDFWCNNNKIKSLEFCPQTVIGYFYCQNNKIDSLKFCPQKVFGCFYCENNPELKEIQNIFGFNLIYLEHERILREILIIKLSDKLVNELTNDKIRRTAKIKI